jgi:anaerobic magnesium-protoporphyrin IX monomethyl ester cyclase
VDVRDYQLCGHENPLEIEHFISFLDDSAPILGISCMNNILPFVLKSTAALKQREPQKIIILGGPGPTSFAEKIMERFDHIDIVSVGEGEQTISNLLGRLQNHESIRGIPGLFYRAKSRVLKTRPPQRIRDLDALPLPAYHLIDLEQYTGDIPIITSRGCPYNCAFCEGSSLGRRKNFRRSNSSILSEIRLLVNTYKRNSIGFVDDIFTLDREKVFHLCRAIIEEHLEFRWNCLCRVNLVDEELVKSMRKAGADGLYFGVESGANGILKRIAKRFVVGEAIEAVKRSKEHIPDIIASFIWGFPYESLEDFFETLLVYGHLSKDEIACQLHLLAPMFHSSLYQEYGDTLSFSRELISDMVLTRYGIESFQDYILAYPDIFLSFWHYRSEEMERKVQILRKMRISHFDTRFEKTVHVAEG